jgi:hypothetical protein
MRTDALISPCGTYRYWLSRVWDESRTCGAWVMLNPSTADATVDDPTIRRIVGFSQSWGWGGARVYNLFALRSPKPSALATHPVPIGPDNDRHLQSIPLEFPVIVAWGQWGNHLGRARSVCAMLARSGIELHCLGRNRDGTPKHPLYVRADVSLLRFNSESDCTP